MIGLGLNYFLLMVDVQYTYYFTRHIIARLTCSEIFFATRSKKILYYPYTLQSEQNENKAIEEISRKSTWRGSFSRLAVLGIVFFEKTKYPFYRYCLGECVYQISGLYRFSFGQEVPYRPSEWQTHMWIKENTLTWIFIYYCSKITMLLIINTDQYNKIITSIVVLTTRFLINFFRSKKLNLVLIATIYH